MKTRVIALIALLSATSARADHQPRSPIDVLKDETPNLIEWALAPLGEPVPPDIRQNLTFVREGLLDEGKEHPVAGPEVYKQAYLLSQSLLTAYDDRDAARARAGIITVQAIANNAAPTSIALEARRNYKFSWPQYKKEQAQRSELHKKSRSDTNAVSERLKGEWVNTVVQMRSRLDNNYARFRGALRENASFKPATDTSQPHNNEPTGSTVTSSKDASHPARELPDLVAPHSVWTEETKQRKLTILDRNGETFGARFESSKYTYIREIKGTIKGNQISWLARDVNPLRGSAGGDNFGAIHGDKIEFSYKDSDGKSGSFTLHLVK